MQSKRTSKLSWIVYKRTIYMVLLSFLESQNRILCYHLPLEFVVVWNKLRYPGQYNAPH